MATSWFPQGRSDGGGWRLDIVSLLAVIGESSTESHSQALTSSWTCILPRIIPAPQALLKATRPTRMPQVNAAVVGVYNGTLVPTLNYFPNIIHPIEDLPPFAFRVYKITHRALKTLVPNPKTEHSTREKRTDVSNSTSIDFGALENGAPVPPKRRTTMQNLKSNLTTTNDKRPRVPSRQWSPLNILNILSCCWTMALIGWAAKIKDGTAITALGTISLVSTIVGFASWWQPILMNRGFKSKVPPGDVVIRTREGAFLVVQCDENVARELYTGTEGCQYYVTTQPYRILVGIGTFLLMVSVVLLGNCNFAMQAAIGSSYIVANGIFWAASLIPRKALWDLTNYVCVDVTPKDSQHAHSNNEDSDSVEDKASFTRTLWYAIRETKRIGWVTRGRAAPETKEWDEWLKLAEEAAVNGGRDWGAVKNREEVVGQAECAPQEYAPEKHGTDSSKQHVPAYEIPPPATI